MEAAHMGRAGRDRGIRRTVHDPFEGLLALLWRPPQLSHQPLDGDFVLREERGGAVLDHEEAEQHMSRRVPLSELVGDVAAFVDDAS
jgi:hypothetical protein